MAKDQKEELNFDDIDGGLHNFDINDDDLELEEKGEKNSSAEIMDSDMDDLSLDADLDEELSLDIGGDVELNADLAVDAALEASLTDSLSADGEENQSRLNDVLGLGNEDFMGNSNIQKKGTKKADTPPTGKSEESEIKDNIKEELNLDDSDILPDDIDGTADEDETSDCEDMSDAFSEKDRAPTEAEDGLSEFDLDDSDMEESELSEDSFFMDLDDTEKNDSDAFSEVLQDAEHLGDEETDPDLESLDSEPDDLQFKSDSSILLDSSTEVKEADMVLLEVEAESTPSETEGIDTDTETAANLADEPMEGDVDTVSDESLLAAGKEIGIEEKSATREPSPEEGSETGSIEGNIPDLETVEETFDTTEDSYVGENDETLMAEMDSDATEPVAESSPGAVKKSEPSAERKKRTDGLIGKELLLSLPHQLTVEIGKANLKGEDLVSLNYGSVIELDKQVGDPVDILLGAKTIAEGEVVQINKAKLGVRITRINV